MYVAWLWWLCASAWNVCVNAYPGIVYYVLIVYCYVIVYCLIFFYPLPFKGLSLFVWFSFVSLSHPLAVGCSDLFLYRLSLYEWICKLIHICIVFFCLFLFRPSVNPSIQYVYMLLFSPIVSNFCKLKIWQFTIYLLLKSGILYHILANAANEWKLWFPF